MTTKTYKRTHLALLASLATGVVGVYLQSRLLIWPSLVVTLVGVPFVLTAGGERCIRDANIISRSVILVIGWLAAAFLLGVFILMKYVVFGPGTTLAH
jgi:hypothetical protein